MEKYLNLSLKDERLENIAKALSNPIRIKILDLLSHESLSVNEIAKKLNQPLTSIAGNIKILEDANLINCIIQAGKHGSMKLCNIVYESLAILFLPKPNEFDYVTKTYNIPLGSFFKADIEPTCGMADENDFIGKDDDIATFYSDKRLKAQIIWFLKGFVEYRIPYDKIGDVEKFELTMEICSEAPYFRETWPSDITLIINNVEVGTYLSPGDFGGRRGNYTPTWWSTSSSQFGLLKQWQINKKGTFIDFKQLSDVNINDVFKKNESPYISIQIGVKKDAKNIGGINIFGEKFGDYPVGLKATISYAKKEKENESSN